VAVVDLFTLQNVKDWLNSSGTQPFPAGTNADALYARVVTAVSQFATSYLQRQIQPATYTEVRNGDNTRSMMLLNRPVLSVTSLTIGTTSIPARSQPGAYGYVTDGASVFIDGGCWGSISGYGYGYGHFPRGIQNIQIVYRAGYQWSDVVTVATPLSVTGLARPWNSDQGVAYANGTALVKVSGAPAAGQYQLGVDSGKTAQYVFNAADVGAAVTITYGYTPEDLVQPLIEIAGERLKVLRRIGETSQQLTQGGTTAFSQKDMNEAARTMLNSYRNVTPIYP